MPDPAGAAPITPERAAWIGRAVWERVKRNEEQDTLAWARRSVDAAETAKAAAARRRCGLEIEALRRELAAAGLPFVEPFGEPFAMFGRWKIEMSGEHRLCASLPDRRYIRFPATPAGAVTFAEFVIQEEGE